MRRAVFPVTAMAALAVACGLDAIGTAPSTTASTEVDGGGGGSSTSSSSGSSSGSSGASQTDAAADGWTLGPRLTLARSPAPFAIDLTTGNADWAYWPTADLVPIRKAGGAILGALQNTGAGAVQVAFTCTTTVTWTDGDPQLVGLTDDCVFVSDDAAKLTMRFAAGTQLRIAHVYFGSLLAKTRVSVRMSDGSLPAPPPIERDEDGAIRDDYRIEVLAPSSGAEVIVDLEMLERRSFLGTDGAIFAGAATIEE